MSFVVVLCHYWSWDDYLRLPVYLKCFVRIRSFAVPLFMIMSFYFLTDSALCVNTAVLKKRMTRLLIPYIGWGFVYYICYTLAEIIFNMELVNGFSDLGWQLLTGASRNLDPPLWFQADLILLTFVILLVFRLVSTDKAFKILLLFTLCAVYMQYSGINVKVFGSWEYETTYTCGRISEMLPYTYVGMVLAYFRIDKKIADRKWFCVITNVGFLILLFKYPVFAVIESQFGYAGIESIWISVLLFLIFLALPFEKLPFQALVAVKWLAKYTLGVFCIHYGVGRLFTIWLSEKGMKAGTFSQCIVIWIISYALSFIISKIPVKICRQLVQ